MYLKALLCLSVVCVYLNPYCIQQDIRIINVHPLPSCEVHVHFQNFAKVSVFLINLNFMETDVLT